MSRLTLVPGAWYGWTMWPGYFDQPYFSPIKVVHVAPRRSGERMLKLIFLNLAYAHGVQQMVYDLKTLRREANYMIAAVSGPSTDRTVAIEPLTPNWMSHHFTDLMHERLFDVGGRPNDHELRRLAD